MSIKFYLRIESTIAEPKIEDREILLNMRDVEYLQKRFGENIDISKIDHSYMIPDRYEALIEVPFKVAKASKKFYDSPTVKVALSTKLDRFFIYEYLEPTTTEPSKVTSLYRINVTLDKEALLALWIKKGYSEIIDVDNKGIINRFTMGMGNPDTYTAGC